MQGHAFVRPFMALAVATLIVVATSSLASPAATAATPACTPDATWGARNAAFEARVLALVNQHRQGMGLSPVTGSATLTDAAAWKAMHMANYRYLEHSDPAPPIARSTGQRLADCGYPTSRAGWGENIAYGYTTPESVMQAWLNSPGHRANIENASYRVLGVAAAAKGSGPMYWAQEFGTLTDAPPVATAASTTRATVSPTPVATVANTATPAPTPSRFPQLTFPSRPWTWPWR